MSFKNAEKTKKLPKRTAVPAAERYESTIALFNSRSLYHQKSFSSIVFSKRKFILNNLKFQFVFSLLF